MSRIKGRVEKYNVKWEKWDKYIESEEYKMRNREEGEECIFFGRGSLLLYISIDIRI